MKTMISHSKTLKINNPTGTAKLIAVPQERLKDIHVSDITHLEDDDNKKYKVIDWFAYKRGDIFPSGMLYLAINKQLTEKETWKHFRKSKYIFLFIVEEELCD